MTNKTKLSTALFLITSSAALNAATDIQVTVTNNAPSNGLYFTPVWSGFHNGSFNLFDNGGMASSGLETLAEEGNPSVLAAEFGTANGRISQAINSPTGPGPGLFAPNATGQAIFTLDEMNNRYFSFASMILPSNDAFIGNGNPTAYELFDAMGNFNGPLTISLFGNNVWDSGTELNDTFGAPFSAIGGTSTDTNQAIALHPGLDNFVGTELGNGTILGTAFTDATPIATITITAVPEPSSFAALAGLAILGVVGSRRRV